MKRRKTVADYLELSNLKVTGAPSRTESRYRRMANLVVDGRPLGEHEIEGVEDRDARKRLLQAQWLAIVLVGCELDHEICEITSLPERGTIPTPDFEATITSGETIRIELTRLADNREKQYIDTIDKIARKTQAILRSLSGDSGTFLLRFYDAPAPGPREIESAAKELAEFIEAKSHLRECSICLYAADDKYPTIHKLGAHVAHLDNDGAFRLEVEASPDVADRQATFDSFPIVWKKKRANFQYYSEGHQVWLALFVDSRPFTPLSIIEELSNDSKFDPRPFSRVFFGCLSAGVTFETPFEKPKYTCLTAAG